MPPQITTHLAWPRCKIKGPQGLLCKIRPLQGYGIGWNGSYEDTPTRCRCIVQLHACCPCWPTCSIARHAHRRCCKSFAVHLHRSKGVPYRPKKDKPPDPEVWGARDTQIEAGGGSPPFLGFINLRPDRFGGPLSGRPFYVPPWAAVYNGFWVRAARSPSWPTFSRLRESGLRPAF